MTTSHFFPGAIVDLALWVSEYYLAGPGDALAAAMPPGAWIESQLRYRLTASGRAALEGAHDGTPRQHVLARLAKGPRTLRGRADVGVATLERDGLIERVTAMTGRARAFRTTLIATLTPAGVSLAAAQGVLPDATLGTRQRAALVALASGQSQSMGVLRDQGVDLGTLRRLAARGLVHLREEVSERDPFAGGAAPVVERDEARALTEEQATALATLASLLDSGAYHAALVHGVTGSGKTELYVRLARHTIAQGRRVLILVPEIALTPQVASQFRAAFGDRVAIQHSGLADGERHDQWHRIRRGEVDLVVGTRSAVFAPLDRLGLLVVDEEHDGSYKQEETPRYNGRDVAVVRAREARALVVLGPPRRRWRLRSTQPPGAISASCCRGESSIGRSPAFASSISGRSTRPRAPMSCSAQR